MYYQHSNTSVESDVDLDDDEYQKSTDNIVDNILDNPLVLGPAQWSPLHQLSPALALQHGPISSFPAELLIYILRHLHVPRDLFHCLLVSRHWCQCSVELLWHKPVFTKYETLTKMTRLLASQNQSFTYPAFIRRLNFLSLGKVLQDRSFSTIAHCSRLERLTLVNCDLLSNKSLTHVLPSFPNLVAVDLSGVGNTSDAAIVGLASSARRLQGINLAGCKHVSDTGVMALATHCPLLRRVKLSGLSQVTDPPISALAKKCPLLLEIDLNKCSYISDISIRDIWSYSTHMREMRLSHCSELTDAAFPSLLAVDDVSNPFQSRSRLQEDQLPPLSISRNFEHLRMLDLTACALVTDNAIQGIISHAPKIRNLVLSKCSLLSDRSVEDICKLGRHLHYLHLGHASKITDKSVRTLARSCARLRYVDFANCTLLTDMSVFELSALTKLRRIGLVRVNRLTDEAIYSLARRHNTLERIHLSYCDQISVMAIHFLLQKLHKLTHLSLTGVPAFRQQELQQFCREPPKEFNEQQQAAFCVYSGKGVTQLRAFLMELFDHITEVTGADDTEFEEDDTDPEPYQEDDIPAGSSAHDATDEVSERIMRHLTLPQFNHHGANEPAQGGFHRHTLPSSSSHRHRSHALPIVEPSYSPPHSDIASIRSMGSHGSGPAFYRNHPEASSSQSNGTRTPDLHFAEIGHGRGAQQLPTLAPFQLRRDATHRPHARPVEASTTASRSSGAPRSHEARSAAIASSSAHWPYEEPNQDLPANTNSSSTPKHSRRKVRSTLSGAIFGHNQSEGPSSSNSTRH